MWKKNLFKIKKRKKIKLLKIIIKNIINDDSYYYENINQYNIRIIQGIIIIGNITMIIYIIIIII